MAARKETITLDSLTTPPDLAEQIEGLEIAESSAGKSEPGSATDTDKTWEVVKYENGLVSMERTPPWLVEVVKRNAAESPLLRLPPELRNKIWRYATTGYIIHVRISDEYQNRSMGWFTNNAKQDVRDLPFRVKALARIPSWLERNEVPTVPAAFHLPKVCRQIYSETTGLIFSESIYFFFYHGWRREPFHVMFTWTSHLNSAQVEDIADIGLDEISMDTYLRKSHSFRKLFPGVKRVHIIGAGGIYWCSRTGPSENPRTIEEWKAWWQWKVNEMEGDGIQLVFHDREDIPEGCC